MNMLTKGMFVGSLSNDPIGRKIMNCEDQIEAAIRLLHDEGRYRTFIDIERERGNFPYASWKPPSGEFEKITVWCGNDYLGMGQNSTVLEAMHEALDDAGAGSGGTRNISGTTIYHKELERELANLHAKESALLFTSAYIANDATLSTLAKLLPNLIIYSDELNHASMIEGIRRNGGDKRIFRHNEELQSTRNRHTRGNSASVASVSWLQ